MFGFSQGGFAESGEWRVLYIDMMSLFDESFLGLEFACKKTRVFEEMEEFVWIGIRDASKLDTLSVL